MVVVEVGAWVGIVFGSGSGGGGGGGGGGLQQFNCCDERYNNQSYSMVQY